MDYLKRFLSFNILSITGYWVLGLCIYTLISILHYGRYLPGIILVLGSIMFVVKAVIFLIYFSAGFLCEFLILFVLSRILKKQVGLNVKNKVYDILFRFGIFSCFIPITIMSCFALLLMLGAIFELFLGPMFKYGDSWISLIILCFVLFDIEIKDIFFKKYFHTKTK